MYVDNWLVALVNPRQHELRRLQLRPILRHGQRQLYITFGGNRPPSGNSNVFLGRISMSVTPSVRGVADSGPQASIARPRPLPPAALVRGPRRNTTSVAGASGRERGPSSPLALSFLNSLSLSDRSRSGDNESLCSEWIAIFAPECSARLAGLPATGFARAARRVVGTGLA